MNLPIASLRISTRLKCDDAAQLGSVICQFKLITLIKPFMRGSLFQYAIGEYFLSPAMVTVHFGSTHYSSNIEMCFPLTAPP